MRRLILFALILLMIVPSTFAQDNPLRNCLDNLEASRLSPFARSYFDTLYDIHASRDIWLGYGNVSERGYTSIDYPGPDYVVLWEVHGLISRSTGEMMSIRVATHAREPGEVYILPLLANGHGGGGCSFYVVLD